MWYFWNRSAVGLAAALAVAAPAALIATDDKPWKKGSSVVLTGCVERAQGDGDDVLLTDVAEVPLGSDAALRPASREPRIYWFDDTDELEDHLGARVRVTGRLEKIDKEEMDVKRRKGAIVVEIEGDGESIETTPRQAGVPAPPPGAKTRDIPYWMLKLKVVNVEVVDETCR